MEENIKKAKGKYEFGPLTEKDVVVNVKQPGKAEAEYLIVDEQEIRLSFQKLGVVPDPRIQIPLLREMDCYEDDIFMCAYPKCGTHWLYEMCQMIIKGKAEFNSQSKEACMLEFHLPDEMKDEPRPRVFNTHFTPICLPKQAVEKKCKFILVHRNPKDIFTSLYHHMVKTKLNVDGDTKWSDFLHYIMDNDREVSSNWFFFNRKWSSFKSSNPDVPVLIVHYEDLKLEPLKNLSRVCKFIGYDRDEGLLNEILDKCSVEKMKDIETKRETKTDVVSPKLVSNLYRKGVVGDWKNQFTVAENEQFDAFLKRELSDDELKFIYEV